MKIIGITSSTTEEKHFLNQAYIRSFTTPNTIPLIIPSFELEENEIISKEFVNRTKEIVDNFVDKLDMLVLSGGTDVNLTTFGKQNVKVESCNTKRDYIELTLARAFIASGKPVVGICRGFQLLSLELGFSNFIQDLSDTKELHDSSMSNINRRDEPLHNVYLLGDFGSWVKKNGFLTEMAGKLPKMAINSWHKQGFSITKKAERFSDKEIAGAVYSYGKKHRVEVIMATNKIVEGFRHLTKPIIGFQFHPEEYKNSIAIQYILEKYL